MSENSKVYWDEIYWEDKINNNRTDFIKGNWMDKYID